MDIQVNGETTQVSGTTIDRILEELGYRGMTVATALNGSFVPAPARPQAAVSPGDRLEILAPLQGG